jgi:PAS domain S-box-containing protein
VIEPTRVADDSSEQNCALQRKTTVDVRDRTLNSAHNGEGRLREVSELEATVGKRFGILPNFFRLTPENPEITAKLWGFAGFAYLDNPLPSLFKERLFVYLSRFCEVRYCIARHVGFLAGLGRASGDAESAPQSIEEIVRLLRRPLPRGEDLARDLSRCAAYRAPLDALEDQDSEEEEVILGLASHVFLQTADASACLDALRCALGESQLQYLLLLLAFVRTAHYWTKIHPELVLEEDIKQLLATHEGLAECVLADPEAASDEVSRRLLGELASLRRQTERDTGLLATIVDTSDDAIVSKNLDGFITSWNKSAERLFGYTAQEAIGRHMTLIIPPDRQDEERRILEQLRRGERVDHFETIRMRKNGTILHVSLTISPIRDAAGRVVGASKVARDITESKHSERSLAEQARLLDLSNDAILVRDADDRITYWNKGASELYGYTPEEALGRVSHELLRTEFPEPLERITEQLRRENRWSGELGHKRTDGKRIAVFSRWAVDRDDRGNLQAVLETNNDITQQKETAKALRESEEHLRALADGLESQVRERTQQLEQRNRELLERSGQLREIWNRLVRTQDQERRHIARELHDSVGQYLAALSMVLESAKNKGSDNPKLEEAARITESCIVEIRTLSHLLHPPLLEEAGLASAVSWYVEGFAVRSGIRAKVEIAEPLGALGKDIDLVLFRILQESLTNVHRHSGSKTVDIRLRADSQQVCLEIEDQGGGGANGSLRPGVGLTSMRERAENLAGELGISSSPSGTLVRVVLPLAPAPRNAKAASQSPAAASQGAGPKNLNSGLDQPLQR